MAINIYWIFNYSRDLSRWSNPEAGAQSIWPVCFGINKQFKLGDERTKLSKKEWEKFLELFTPADFTLTENGIPTDKVIITRISKRAVNSAEAGFFPGSLFLELIRTNAEENAYLSGILPKEKGAYNIYSGKCDGIRLGNW